jgi:osmotically-inducible protein OsmY
MGISAAIETGTSFDVGKGTEDARCVRAAASAPGQCVDHTMTRTQQLLIAGLLAVSLAGVARAEDIPERKDFQVFQGVARQVQQYVNFTVFDSVDASVQGGVVTLTGKVTMPFKVQDLTRRVSRVEGVRKVDNQIKVLPVSRFDDELRMRIARAIYGNPSFWHYASMANPPIHIVVEQGRVKLEGTVNSNVERMLAQSLAIGFGEFSIENRLRTDAERQVELEQIN